MKVAIRFEVVMEYEVPGDTFTDAEARKWWLEWWLEEGHCHLNIAEALAELVKSDDAASVCNLCRFSKVTMLPEGTPAYRGKEG